MDTITNPEITSRLKKANLSDRAARSSMSITTKASIATVTLSQFEIAAHLLKLRFMTKSQGEYRAFEMEND